MIDYFDGKNEFLTNFFHAPVSYEGITYPTNEHFFQAMKTLDVELRQKIATASTPGEAKRLGRNVTLRQDWESVKEEVMKVGLTLKFTTYKTLQEKLLATGDEELVEGNWWHDNEWGNCTCKNCQNKRGKNKLGICLMRLREELKEKNNRGSGINEVDCC